MARQGTAGHGKTGQGTAKQSRAGQGRAKQSTAGQGTAGQGTAGQGRVFNTGEIIIKALIIFVVRIILLF